MNVNGYELVGDWKVANKGFTAQATKGGKRYFLKRYNFKKMPRHDASTTPASYERLKKEFESFMNNRIAINKALRELAGPGGNIILPMNWFVDDICYVEATEFVGGLIEDEAILTLTDDEKLFIMLTAAASLYNIHKKKIVHSDLKRTNILAARNSTGRIAAKIIDFDMSYFENDIRPKELGGDQNFMSPELAQCFVYDFIDEALECLSTKSDIFSLGLVFHDYLVTEKYTDETGKKRTRGCHPKIEGLKGKLKENFEAGKTVYCSEALLNEARLVVSGKIKEKYLRHVIAAMLQPEPEDRPTAQEVLEALRTKKVLDLKSDWIRIEGEDDGGSSAPEESPAPAGSTASSGRPAPAPTPAPAPAVPKGFCAPWGEHSGAFAEDRLSASGYVASEQFNKDGKKCYYLYKRDGSKRLFTFENLVLLGLMNRTGAPSKPAPGATTATPPPSPKTTVSEEGKLWDEHSDFSLNLEAVKRGGYKSIARAEKNGVKGYVLIKDSGDQRFFTIGNLKLLGYVVKK